MLTSPTRPARPSAHPQLDRWVMRIGFLPPVHATVENVPAMKDFCGRFACPDRQTAIAMATHLSRARLLVSVHLRDETVRDDAQADRQARAYSELVSELARAGLCDTCEISVKLEQLGLYAKDGEHRAVTRLAGLALEAAAAGVHTTLDMEGVDEVPVTLEAAREVRRRVPGLGVALQAYLPRTYDDCVEFGAEGGRVRLCKGGYSRRPGMTYATRHEVDLAYIRCARALLDVRSYPMFATHDGRLVEILTTLVDAGGLPSEGYEFQVLAGMGAATMQRLVDEGRSVRVYLPFGPQWYAWFLGRLAEKPGNVALLARVVLGGR